MMLWWAARSERERWLVGAMLVLAVVVLGWLLVVRPLSDALDAAKIRHGDAAAALAEARARARPAAAGPAAAGPAEAIVVRSAGAAGFPGARVVGQGPGRAMASLDAARPQALFAWIAQMETQGLAVARLNLHANQDHTLAAELVMEARR